MTHQDTFRKAVSLRLLNAPHAVLMVLWNSSGAGRDSTDVMGLTGLTMANVSMAKKKLLAEGSLEERVPFRDTRRAKMYLTADGERRASELWNSVFLLGQSMSQFRQDIPSD